jgi:hypothetical protein
LWKPYIIVVLGKGLPFRWGVGMVSPNSLSGKSTPSYGVQRPLGLYLIICSQTEVQKKNPWGCSLSYLSGKKEVGIETLRAWAMRGATSGNI